MGLFKKKNKNTAHSSQVLSTSAGATSTGVTSTWHNQQNWHKREDITELFKKLQKDYKDYRQYGLAQGKMELQQGLDPQGKKRKKEKEGKIKKYKNEMDKHKEGYQNFSSNLIKLTVSYRETFGPYFKEYKDNILKKIREAMEYLKLNKDPYLKKSEATFRSIIVDHIKDYQLETRPSQSLAYNEPLGTGGSISRPLAPQNAESFPELMAQIPSLPLQPVVQPLPSKNPTQSNRPFQSQIGTSTFDEGSATASQPETSTSKSSSNSSPQIRVLFGKENEREFFRICFRQCSGIKDMSYISNEKNVLMMEAIQTLCIGGDTNFVEPIAVDQSLQKYYGDFYCYLDCEIKEFFNPDHAYSNLRWLENILYAHCFVTNKGEKLYLGLCEQDDCLTVYISARTNIDEFIPTLRKDDRDTYRIDYHLFGRKIFEIFAMWAGRIAIPKEVGLQDFDLQKNFISKKFAEHIHAKNLHNTDLALDQSFLETLGCELFKTDRQIEIYAENIHPLFINYFIEKIQFTHYLPLDTRVRFADSLERGFSLERFSSFVTYPLGDRFEGKNYSSFPLNRERSKTQDSYAFGPTWEDWFYHGPYLVHPRPLLAFQINETFYGIQEECVFDSSNIDAKLPDSHILPTVSFITLFTPKFVFQSDMNKKGIFPLTQCWDNRNDDNPTFYRLLPLLSNSFFDPRSCFFSNIYSLLSIYNDSCNSPCLPLISQLLYIISTTVFELRHKFKFESCDQNDEIGLHHMGGERLKNILDPNEFHREFFRYFLQHRFSVINQLKTDYHLKIYPLAHSHLVCLLEQTDFIYYLDQYNKKALEEYLQKTLRQEEWRRQFLIVVNGKPLPYGGKEDRSPRSDFDKEIVACYEYIQNAITNYHRPHNAECLIQFDNENEYYDLLQRVEQYDKMIEISSVFFTHASEQDKSDTVDEDDKSELDEQFAVAEDNARSNQWSKSSPQSQTSENTLDPEVPQPLSSESTSSIYIERTQTEREIVIKSTSETPRHKIIDINETRVQAQHENDQNTGLLARKTAPLKTVKEDTEFDENLKDIFTNKGYETENITLINDEDYLYFKRCRDEE